jgi:hypothetical protein
MTSPGRLLPTTLFLSVHKGASTFVNGVLAFAAEQLFPGLQRIPYGEALNRGSRLEDLPLPPTGVIATRVYPDLYHRLIEEPAPPAGRFTDKRLVVTRRDPRDVAVSWYHSLAVSHPVPPGPAREPFLAKRAAIREMDVQAGIARFTARQAIDEFRQATDFLQRHPWAIDLSYELLVTDCRAWFERLVAHLGWPEAIVDHLGPVLAREVAPPPREDPRQHKRRVRPGNWREVFDEALCERFREEIGEDLEAAGYRWDGALAEAS